MVGCILKEYTYSGIFLCFCAGVRIEFMASALTGIGCECMECKFMESRHTDRA